MLVSEGCLAKDDQTLPGPIGVCQLVSEAVFMTFPVLPPYLAQFADHRRYCLWLNIKDKPDDKPRKIPFGAGGRGNPARSDDPSTWLTWPEMLDLMREMPRPPATNEGGPGVFLGGGLAGFDLDSCLGPCGLEPWAADLIGLLGNAIEISPSGTGLKAFMWTPDPASVKQTLGWDADRSGGPLWKSPTGESHPAGIEYYDSFRYFAVTGNAITSASDGVGDGGVGGGLGLLTIDVARQIRGVVDDLIRRFGMRRPSLRSVTGGSGGSGSIGTVRPVLPDQGAARVRVAVLAALPVRARLAALLAGGSIDGLSDQSRSSRAYHLAQELIVACGLSESDWIEFVCREAEEGGLIRCDALRSWIAEKGVRDNYRELKRAYGNTPPGLSMLSFAGVPPIDGGNDGGEAGFAGGGGVVAGGQVVSGGGSGGSGEGGVKSDGGDAGYAAIDLPAGTVIKDLIEGMEVKWRGSPPDHPRILKSLNGEGRLTIYLSTGRQALNIEAALLVLSKSGLPIFRRGDYLVTPVEMVVPAGRKKRTKTIAFRRLTSDKLRVLLNKVANWQIFNRLAKGPVECSPSKDLADLILGATDDWPFPHVAGIVTCPTMRDDTTLICRDGYDPATQLWAYFNGAFPDCQAWEDEQPVRSNAIAALGVLDRLLDEFPFESESDRSVALSYLLTSVIRTALELAPLHAFRANAPGSGKTYIVNVGAVMVTGRACPVVAASVRQEEQEKRLGSMMQTGVPLISIDNLNGELRSDLLCQAVEQPYVSIRPLGLNDIIEVENRAMFVANGNQMRVGGDMARRVLWCNLYIDMERPETRVFRGDPVGAVLADRAQYVHAVLTIVRAHALAGLPGKQLLREPYLSYGDYSAMVRGALAWLDRADPLETARNNREEDPDYQNLMVLLTAWRDRIGTGPASACTIKQAFEATLQTAPPLDAAGFAEDAKTEKKEEILMEERQRRQFSPVLRDAMLAVAGERGNLNTRILARWLLRHEKRIASGLRFEKGKSDRNGVFTWFVARSMNGLKAIEDDKNDK